MEKNFLEKLFPGVQASGTYLGFVVIWPMAKEQVRAMLPEGIALAPQALTPSDAHPVILMFGEQVGPYLEPTLKLFEVEPYLEALARRLELGYLQFSVVIPLVQWASSTIRQNNPFSIMPGLYVNKTLPRFSSSLYGFATHEASIGLDNTAYIVNDLETNKVLVMGEFKFKGRTESPKAFPLFEQAIPSLFQPTYVGQTPFGSFVYTSLDWGLAQAEIQAVKAEVTIPRPLEPGLPEASFTRPSLEVDPLGAFRLCTRWSLSLPRPCLV